MVANLKDLTHGATPSEGAKRKYPAHFISKLTDSDGENMESQHWIDTAEACGYIDTLQADKWRVKSEQIGRKLGSIMAKHESFCL